MNKENLWNRLNKQFAGSRVGRLIGPKILHHIDRFLSRLTGDRLTLTRVLGGVSPVWLTSTGARSGQLRTVPLVGLQDGEKVILVASNWGQKHYPGWYYNLCANPVAEVRIDKKSQTYMARQAHGEEYEGYWQRIVDFHPGYENYKVSAGKRAIPIFVLELLNTPDGDKYP